jgi:hypothetical protein
LKLPLGVLSHLRGSLGGFASSGGSRGSESGGDRGRSGGFQRVGEAHARLRAGGLQAGRTVGLAAGALGAPVGGPLRSASRATGQLSRPLLTGASFAGGALGSRAATATSRLSRASDGSPSAEGSRSARACTVRERVGRAARTFTDVTQRLRDAARGPDARPGQQSHDGDTSHARRGPNVALGRSRAGLGGGERSDQSPRPSRRGAPAGGGDTRASSATGRGGSSDGRALSRRSGDSREGKVAPPGQSAPPPSLSGSARRDDALAADSRARRQGSRPTARKPPPVVSPERQRPRPEPSRKTPAPRSEPSAGKPPRRVPGGGSTRARDSRAGWLAHLRLRRG